jgi:alkanesulfonate monooxygenase SsuD/methylene tetrahydromethanopterin reductase-like flavin-dependent oxidoreductase (luciferase family)
VVLPERVESPYVLTRKPVRMAEGELASAMAPDFETTTTLAYAAAVTTTIKIGTAVAVLTIRTPSSTRDS